MGIFIGFGYAALSDDISFFDFEPLVVGAGAGLFAGVFVWAGTPALYELVYTAESGDAESAEMFALAVDRLPWARIGVRHDLKVAGVWCPRLIVSGMLGGYTAWILPVDAEGRRGRLHVAVHGIVGPWILHAVARAMRHERAFSRVEDRAVVS